MSNFTWNNNGSKNNYDWGGFNSNNQSYNSLGSNYPSLGFGGANNLGFNQANNGWSSIQVGNQVPLSDSLGINSLMNPNQWQAIGGTGGSGAGAGGGGLTSGLGKWWGGLSGSDQVTAIGQGIGGLASLVQGFQANSMAKKQMNAAIDQWNQQWTAQKKMTNEALRDKYKARLAGAGTGAQNMETEQDYMKRRGV